MRVMALDLGDKRIGVALSDALGITAQGLETYNRQSLEKDFAHFEELARTHEVSQIVLGLPVNMNGTLGPRAKTVQNWGKKLGKQLNIPVDYADERLSTVSVERVLVEADISRKKRRQVVDKLAAVEILRGYLEAGKNRIIEKEME